MDKNQTRLRRSRKTRAKIAELKVARLAVHRTNCHIYAQIFDAAGTKVLTSASTLEADVRKELANGGNVSALKRWPKPRVKAACSFNRGE
jgi:large subunit ribosomal protein L18